MKIVKRLFNWSCYLACIWGLLKLYLFIDYVVEKGFHVSIYIPYTYLITDLLMIIIKTLLQVVVLLFISKQLDKYDNNGKLIEEKEVKY